MPFFFKHQYRMAEIIRMFSAFDDAMVKTMCVAYDCAINCLQNNGREHIAPEVVAQHVVSFARQGFSSSAIICLLTLRAINKGPLFDPIARPDNDHADTEFLWYARDSVKRAAELISDSLTLVRECEVLIAQVDRQLNGSRGKTASLA